MKASAASPARLSLRARVVDAGRAPAARARRHRRLRRPQRLARMRSHSAPRGRSFTLLSPRPSPPSREDGGEVRPLGLVVERNSSTRAERRRRRDRRPPRGSRSGAATPRPAGRGPSTRGRSTIGASSGPARRRADRCAGGDQRRRTIRRHVGEAPSAGRGPSHTATMSPTRTSPPATAASSEHPGPAHPSSGGGATAIDVTPHDSRSALAVRSDSDQPASGQQAVPSHGSDRATGPGATRIASRSMSPAACRQASAADGLGDSGLDLRRLWRSRPMVPPSMAWPPARAPRCTAIVGTQQHEYVRCAFFGGRRHSVDFVGAPRWPRRSPRRASASVRWSYFSSISVAVVAGPLGDAKRMIAFSIGVTSTRCRGHRGHHDHIGWIEDQRQATDHGDIHDLADEFEAVRPDHIDLSRWIRPERHEGHGQVRRSRPAHGRGEGLLALEPTPFQIRWKMNAGGPRSPPAVARPRGTAWPRPRPRRVQ